MLDLTPHQVIDGKRVRLELLCDRHVEGLKIAVADGKLWQIPETMVPFEEEISGFIQKAVTGFANQTERAYVIVEKESNSVVGSSRLMNINSQHSRIELGYTFIAASWQRTFVNTESKLLLLQIAFENMHASRVELLTDLNNHNSQRAIERIGGVKEGVMRQHMILRKGRKRDSVIYSILNHEWPSVKDNLNRLLAAYSHP